MDSTSLAHFPLTQMPLKAFASAIGVSTAAKQTLGPVPCVDAALDAMKNRLLCAYFTMNLTFLCLNASIPIDRRDL